MMDGSVSRKSLTRALAFKARTYRDSCKMPIIICKDLTDQDRGFCLSKIAQRLHACHQQYRFDSILSLLFIVQSRGR